MTTHLEHLENLKEIRSIMDRSSRFLSLSGLSGVSAGVFALAVAGVVKWYLRSHSLFSPSFTKLALIGKLSFFSGTVAALVMVLAVGVGGYLTLRKARLDQLPVWDNQARRLLFNLALPLAAGGVFCAALLYHHLLFLIAPSMLLFYGMALLNASKYTLRDIRYLGLLEMRLGLLTCFLPGFGLLAWTIGFGLLHILYGTIMYVKYEREAQSLAG